MTKAKKFNIGEWWNSLPKWIKIIPYVVASGGLASLIKYLSELEVSDVLLAGILNIIIVLLKQGFDYIKEKRK